MHNDERTDPAARSRGKLSEANRMPQLWALHRNIRALPLLPGKYAQKAFHKGFQAHCRADFDCRPAAFTVLRADRSDTGNQDFGNWPAQQFRSRQDCRKSRSKLWGPPPMELSGIHGFPNGTFIRTGNYQGIGLFESRQGNPGTQSGS